VIGLRYRERAPSEVRAEDRQRLDALYAAGLGLLIVDPLSGRCLTALHVILALRGADRMQMLRAILLEVESRAAVDRVVGKREAALLELAGRLVERDGTPESLAYYRATLGLTHYFRGNWKAAFDILDSAFANVPTSRAGWQATARQFSILALVSLGELREATRRQTRQLHDAEIRGDLPTSVNLRTGRATTLWLATDEPETLRRHVGEALAQWSKRGFLLQHANGAIAMADVEIYEGHGERAYQILERQARAVRRSFLLNLQPVRAAANYVRGRAAIASLDVIPDGKRSSRVAEAARIAKRLDGERLTYTSVYGSILKAGVAAAQGDTDGARTALLRAIELADAASMTIHAAAARSSASEC
jgi:hypothetical protein